MSDSIISSTHRLIILSSSSDYRSLPSIRSPYYSISSTSLAISPAFVESMYAGSRTHARVVGGRRRTIILFPIRPTPRGGKRKPHGEIQAFPPRAANYLARASYSFLGLSRSRSRTGGGEAAVRAAEWDGVWCASPAYIAGCDATRSDRFTRSLSSLDRVVLRFGPSGRGAGCAAAAAGAGRVAPRKCNVHVRSLSRRFVE